MTRAKNARPEPIVTYRPKIKAMNKPEFPDREACIQTICDRDNRIARLEFALKEIKRILIEEPSEIGTALRVIQAGLNEDDES